MSPLTYPEERAARSQRETMLVDSRYRIRNGTALQWQPAAGACTVLSEFTASNFTVHRLLESSEKAFPPWLGSSLPPPPPSSLFSFPLYSFHPLHSSAVFPLPEGRVSRGDSLRVQDRTTPLYISIPQLRRRFSPRLDKKKGTLVRDDQPRETVARKGWVVDNVGNRPRRWRESHPLSEGSRGISQLSRKYSRVPIHLSFGFSFFSLSLSSTARFSSRIYTRCKILAPLLLESSDFHITLPGARLMFQVEFLRNIFTNTEKSRISRVSNCRQIKATRARVS